MPGINVDDDLIRRLAALIDETGLTEIEYAEGLKRIRVAKGAAPTMAAHVPSQESAPSAGSPAAMPDVRPDASHPGAVTAPMVGTAYLQPEPSSPQFVSSGDRVEKGQVLLIIEAMKVMNQIVAPRAGTVRQIFVSNGAPVEYGEILMIVD